MTEQTNNANSYRVDLGDRAYDIHIEPGCLDGIGEALSTVAGDARRCLVVSNETVAPLYMERLRRSLERAGWRVSECILPDGERYKTLEIWSKILDALMQARLSRNEPVLALGGGVVGDMVGFAAACYRRGIPFVQVPTTLLAQVDSSVGGKTAINHPLGKNMIGAFYQPKLVWIDPETLRTLDERELRAGLGEAVKYGLIRDAEFFLWCAGHARQALDLDAGVLSILIHTCCRHKAEVVMADETEQGMRALLNLGHTFGHAIEAMTGYSEYLHGEAVAIGTVMAARLSGQLGYARPDIEGEIRACYEGIGLPLEPPRFEADAWLDAMGHDKKNIGSRIRYVLLREVGDAFVAEDVPSDAIRTLVASFD